MIKTDRSIRNIALAAIKRSSNKNTECVFTKIFETQSLEELNLNISINENELPIAGTFLSSERITLVTTQRVMTLDGGKWKQMHAKKISEFFFEGFKGYDGNPYATGYVTGVDSYRLPVFIETKAPSLIIMNAIHILQGAYGNG